MSQAPVGRSPNGGRRVVLPLPPPRRACHRDGGRVVERVVEKSTAGIAYPMLTCTNYMEWLAVMRVNLQAAGLWEAIQYGDAEYRNDRHVLAVLLRTVPVEMQASLTNKETTCEAWEAIHRVRIGANRVKEANAYRLWQEFAEWKFKAGEGVEDFTFRITALVNQLRILGDDITNKEVLKKMLHSVSEKLEQVAISMETLLDLNSLSIEEATSHLLAVEQRRKKGAVPAADVEGRLLMTDEEWTTRMNIKEKGGSSGSGASGGGGDRHGRG
jgi:hypothetical protein